MPPPVSAVHPFAATRPIPLAEQPTVPVSQVEGPIGSPAATLLAAPAPGGMRPSAPGSPRASAPPVTTSSQPPFERTLPLRSSAAPVPSAPVPVQGTLVLKLLAAAAAASVAFAAWWWLR
jgi:hypothetical protein